MLISHQHPLNRSIMLSVLGVPNVGKSSLVNYLMGLDLSVVTHIPQTTRNKFHCILSIDRVEIILVDTPGIHKSNKEFNKRMNQQAREGTSGADINLLLIDLTKDIPDQISSFQSNFKEELGRSWMVFTKSDIAGTRTEESYERVFKEASELYPNLEKYFVVSSISGDNVHLLTGAICDAAPSGPHLYTKGEASNKNERFFVTEYIREQASLLLRDELPHEIAVLIDEYKDYRDLKDEMKKKICTEISATILVNRPSQRAIVIGTKGSMIKNIGINSRVKIETMVGGKIHLKLHVKVSPCWFKNNFVLEELGLPRAHDSNRVWRQK